ncbi:MAG TPA: aspartate kinase [Thermoanaerobaculia bacterium]|nr:aspartate kinase [Thermoanaerobaculia bacterium]
MRTGRNGLTVHKFGGASLADADAMRHAIALTREAPGQAAVVASALGGVTDLLTEAAAAVGKDAGRIREIAADLKKRYRKCVIAVVPAGPSRRDLEERVERAFEELSLLSRAPDFVRDLSAAALDTLLARGEEIAALIFAAGLTAAGRRAEWVDPLHLIVTDGRFGGASPRLAETDRNIRRLVAPILAKKLVPVVPGFTGAAPDGRTVTLGRGGSDLTATLLARALSAKAVFLWKDVPGMLTADPRVVPNARVIPQLNVREAAELAYYGAKVLHPRAIIPIARRGIPVFVRPFAEPDKTGTEISRRQTLARYPVKALSAISGQALLTVSGNGMLGVPGIAARTFSALHRDGISVSLISQASSEHSICLSVPEAQASRARSSLLEAFAEEISRKEIDGVELAAGLSTISVVGLGMAGTPGIAARVFSALARGGINVVAIAQGSSELNISFVVSQEQAPRAQRRVHDAFQLSKIGGGGAQEGRPADVALLGFGQVGRTLAGLVRASRGGRLRLCAVIDRGGFVFRPEGLSASDLDALSAAKKRGGSVASTRTGRKASPEQAIAALSEHALSRPILVDVTAESTAPLLEKAAAAGFDLVLANKRPLSGSRDEAEGLRNAVDASGRRLRFEATVGAGLPILDTHRKLVESGDRVVKIEGCLSGTLGFLLSEIEKGSSFSSSLKRAMESGYTEPDPRDDLSGADVGRKALILGRLLGFPGGPGDVAVESLVPEGVRGLSLPDFLAGLTGLDAEWEERARRAKSRARILRYVASVTPRRIQVGLAEVAPGSPFFGLKGTDNQVAFTTSRYRLNPLVIQGPGAGLAVTAGGIFNDVADLSGA